MKKFLRSLLPIFILAFVLISCEKNNDDPVTPPDPSGKIYKSEIKVTFEVSENVYLGISNFGLADANGVSITTNIYQQVVVPEFTYQMDTVAARANLGKKILVYFAGAQVVDGVNHGFEMWVPIDPLKEKNDVKIKLEYPL